MNGLLSPFPCPGSLFIFSSGIAPIVASVTTLVPSATPLMIALYIAMDSFGTACNVTGDGAIALIIDKVMGKGTGK